MIFISKKLINNTIHLPTKNHFCFFDISGWFGGGGRIVSPSEPRAYRESISYREIFYSGEFLNNFTVNYCFLLDSRRCIYIKINTRTRDFVSSKASGKDNFAFMCFYHCTMYLHDSNVIYNIVNLCFSN